MKTERSKAGILERVHTERRRLEQNLVGLTPAQMEVPGVVGASSVKDVLAHLAEWEALCLGWVAATLRGDQPAVPAPGVTFGNLDPLNRQIYLKYKDCSVDEVLNFFRDTHQQFLVLLDGLTEEQVLKPGTFPWTGKSAFYGWIAAYANHDLWGKTKIRAWRKGKIF